MTENIDATLSTQDIFALIKKVMLDPTRVAIWFEILRKPGITAKELMKIIAIQKTAMYYHLKILEEHSVISTTRSKGSKHFNIVLNFFDLYQVDKSEFKGNEREFTIFSLLIANSLMHREINEISSMTDKEFKEREKSPIHHIGMWFCTKEKLVKLKEEYQTLWNKIKEVDETEDTQESIVNAEYGYYWGLADFT